MIDLDRYLTSWPVERVAAVAVGREGIFGGGGDPDAGFRLASISKLFVAMAILVAVEEGSVSLDRPAGGVEGATLRHLLAHASGLGFDHPRTVAGVGTRRVYSNVGIERAADHLTEVTGMPFSDYLAGAVLEPLGMGATELVGSPAHGIHGSAADLARFVTELLSPTLVSPATLAEAVSPQFPHLAGVLPGIGRFDPNPWGLGFEIKGGKHPHWSGTGTSTATFGHFGGSGTFLWVDPVIGLGLVGLADREFGEWAMETWPSFSDRVIEEFTGENRAGAVEPM